MKITMNNGITFEGTQTEYEEFLAYAERKIAEDEAKEAQIEETIEFEGATYHKVEREAREGDVVIFKGVECQSSYTEDGVPYKVIAENTYVLEDGDGYSISGCDYHSVDVYEPIEQAKYVPQEGDIVVITGNTNNSRNKVGEIGIVAPSKRYNRIVVNVPGSKDTGDGFTTTKPSEVRKATPAEVEKYEQALMEIEKAHKDTEIAEKWAKIGRKPNEFKKGDVVRVVERLSSDFAVGTLGIVMRDEIDDCCRPTTKAITTDGKLLSFHPRVELVAPVESLFNANA